MSNLTRFTLGVLVHDGTASVQPRPTTATLPPGYDVAILILSIALVRFGQLPTVRVRQLHHIAIDC